MISLPFPTEALPDTIQKAVEEVTSIIEAPDAIAVASALSANLRKRIAPLSKGWAIQ
jgi:hypothetical protein